MSAVIHDETIVKLEDDLNKSSGMKKPIPLNTANISKFSASENAPKNLENMSHYVSIF